MKRLGIIIFFALNTSLMGLAIDLDGGCETITNSGVDINKATIAYKPENTVFAFDLHKVLVSTDFNELIKTISQEFSSSDVWYMIRTKEIRRTLKSISKGKITAEKALDDLAKKYPRMAKLKQPFLKLMNCQKINHGILDIVKQIKESGYRVYLLSNIGIQTLKEFYKKHPELEKLFDGFYVPSPENNYTKKPNPDFFCQFKDYLVKIGDKQKNIIFVDDDLKNIKTAKQHGFKALVFNSKRLLERDLKKLGINLKPLTKNLPSQLCHN